MSISHTSQIPVLAGGFITNETIKSKISLSARQCKIIATIGPSCWTVEQLETLMDSGMNTALLNMTHGDHSSHSGIVDRIRQAATSVRRNIAIWMDLMGPDLRTGNFANDVKQVELTKGDILVLTASDPKFLGDKNKIACTYSKLASVVKPGQQILIADGSLVLTVIGTDVSYGEVACRIENSTTLGETKNVCLPGIDLDLPTFTAKDVDDIINFGIVQKVDIISISFVRKPQDVIDLRHLLSENGGQDIKIISKIDNIRGLENFFDILQVSDGIMISRGNLGMEIAPQKIFLAQKMMIRECNIVGKPVTVATQMLESMITNPRPTRAECSDVANAVLDGTDSLMLSGETAISPYADKAVRVMARTICEAESCRNYNSLYQSIRNSVISRFGTMSATESLASSAVKTAIDVNARLIVVLSQTGYTARFIAKFRPGRFIVCLTNNATVARQTCGLLKGVHSYLVNSLSNDSYVAQETGKEAIKAGIASAGELMVIVCGTIHGEEPGTGKTNQVRVESILEPDDDDDDKVAEIKGQEDIPTRRPRRNTFSKLQSFEVAYNDEVDGFDD